MTLQAKTLFVGGSEEEEAPALIAAHRSSGALPPKGLIAAPDVSLMQTLNIFHILLRETLTVLLFAEQQVSLPIVPQK